MPTRNTLCALIGAALLSSANAETLSKEQLLEKYAPVFEQTIENLQTQGYKTAPIETYFIFGSAEVKPTYTTGKSIHDEGTAIETYGAFPISYRVMQIWGPCVGYNPKSEGLSAKEFNKKLLHDEKFNIEMAAIRLSGIIEGSDTDKNVDSYRKNFLQGKQHTDLDVANIISYIAHRGSKELKQNIDRVKTGMFNFTRVPDRKNNILRGMDMAKAYVRKHS